MRLLKTISEGYRSWRHTRGYGVHSPFAFEIVELLRERRDCRFYAEDSLKPDAIDEGGSRLWKDTRMLHRLCSRFAAGRVWLPSDAPESIRNAVALASSRHRIVSETGQEKDCDMIFMPSVSICEAAAALPDGGVAVLMSADSGEAEKALRMIPGGLLLKGRTRTLIFRRDTMRHNSYTMAL